LLCLPEPFRPLKGFSWNRTVKPWSMAVWFNTGTYRENLGRCSHGKGLNDVRVLCESHHP
jgi:hypothetical protein